MTANNKVLFVDDDQHILSSFKRRLGRRFSIMTALSGQQALDLLQSEGPIAVVISDQRMPNMDGVQFLSQVKKTAPDTVRIMLTGNTDLETAIKAVNNGSVFRLYTKPCPPEEMADAIEYALKQYNLVTSERELLERTLAGSLKVLVDVLSLADPVAFQKTQTLRGWTSRVARYLGLENLWELDIAAMLSPLGLITIPDEITKQARTGATLKKADQEIYDRFPEIGKNLIANIPRMKEIGEIILYQNKGFDGSGFPDDWVAGEDIPLGSRILRILIDLAAITDSPNEDAFALLEKQDHLYDPDLLRTVRSCFTGDGAPTEAAEYVVIKVPAEKLYAGVRLVSNIETEDGVLILAAGIEITPAQLERILNLRMTRPLKEPIHIAVPADKAGGD
ncbi:MAG: response regulator [Minwuiales bacterium]|nr:response regulator [Minwuiales bacterium]